MNHKTESFNAKIMCLMCLRDAEDVLFRQVYFMGSIKDGSWKTKAVLIAWRGGRGWGGVGGGCKRSGLCIQYLLNKSRNCLFKMRMGCL
jgi:hypothetical protein